jgi:hypothetical protein
MKAFHKPALCEHGCCSRQVRAHITTSSMSRSLVVLRTARTWGDAVLGRVVIRFLGLLPWLLASLLPRLHVLLVVLFHGCFLVEGPVRSRVRDSVCPSPSQARPPMFRPQSKASTMGGHGGGDWQSNQVGMGDWGRVRIVNAAH